MRVKEARSRPIDIFRVGQTEIAARVSWTQIVKMVKHFRRAFGIAFFQRPHAQMQEAVERHAVLRFLHRAVPRAKGQASLTFSVSAR